MSRALIEFTFGSYPGSQAAKELFKLAAAAGNLPSHSLCKPARKTAIAADDWM
jgi:hypothetical protein